MVLRCATSLLGHQQFTVSAQMFKPSRKTVLKQLVDCKTAKSVALMTVMVFHTNSFMVLADHRCHWPAAAKARTQSSASYDGAIPCRHLKTITASLHSVRCRIGSQWRSHNTAVMWSNFLVPVTCAAKFWTFFSRPSLTLYSRQLQ